jgi:hypothetical protein
MRIDRSTKLPRYNMAFELGLFLGCCEFGGKGHKGKSRFILDRERWRYRSSPRPKKLSSSAEHAEAKT